MNLDNTTTSQDNEIASAASRDHIGNLIDIIEELDSKITRWRVAAAYFSCTSPEELKSWYDEYSRNEGAPT